MTQVEEKEKSQVIWYSVLISCNRISPTIVFISNSYESQIKAIKKLLLDTYNNSEEIKDIVAKIKPYIFDHYDEELNEETAFTLALKEKEAILTNKVTGNLKFLEGLTTNDLQGISVEEFRDLVMESNAEYFYEKDNEHKHYSVNKSDEDEPQELKSMITIEKKISKNVINDLIQTPACTICESYIYIFKTTYDGLLKIQDLVKNMFIG